MECKKLTETLIYCKHDNGISKDRFFVFLNVFLIFSGIWLRTPPGAHLERPESSFGALGELIFDGLACTRAQLSNSAAIGTPHN